MHLHVCVVDGVFEAISGDEKTALAIPSGVNFHPASGLDEAAVAQVQAAACTRILRAFVGRGLIESFDTAASRWMPGCALRLKTAQGWSAC